jgi:hypothetical protein
LACALITEANSEPFCSRLTRWDTGVLEAKNLTQFDAIVAAVPDSPPAGADEVGEDAEGEAGGLELPPAPEPELPPQPAASTPIPTASTGATDARRINARNRIVSVSFPSVILLAPQEAGGP